MVVIVVGDWPSKRVVDLCPRALRSEEPLALWADFFANKARVTVPEMMIESLTCLMFGKNSVWKVGFGSTFWSQ